MRKRDISDIYIYIYTMIYVYIMIDYLINIEVIQPHLANRSCEFRPWSLGTFPLCEAPLSAAATEGPAAPGHDPRLCSSTIGDLAKHGGSEKPPETCEKHGTTGTTRMKMIEITIDI